MTHFVLDWGNLRQGSRESRDSFIATASQSRCSERGCIIKKNKNKYINKKQSLISSNDNLQSCHYPNYGGLIEVESSIKLWGCDFVKNKQILFKCL